jgi:hypothetical protein
VGRKKTAKIRDELNEEKSGVHFIKHDIQGVFLKCAEILPTRW